MAIPDPFALNILGVQDLVSSPVNKSLQSPITSQDEGIKSEEIDSFELKMDDDELIYLAKRWEARYAPYEAKLRPRQQTNLQFYLGKQVEGVDSIAANLIFEAEETFLPAALSKNPDPVVFSDNSPQGNDLADMVTTMLQYHADALAIRRKLTLMTRNWSLDFLGVIKYGWDSKLKDIKLEVRDVKNFIFDPSGYVDPFGKFVGYLGERITVTAERLIEMFPKYTEYIKVMVDGKLGTEVAYTEWWKDEYCFYTFKDKVLDKNKNHYFNYDSKTKSTQNENGEAEEGETIQGKNHFAGPEKPYTFLSVFSLGLQPHDITGLIEQNIPNQRLITKRIGQIDYNISRTNHSRAYSENNFNQETAKQASSASNKGHDILVPSGGPIREAIADFPPPPLASSFFTDLDNNMNNLRTIFGTQGITAQQQDEDQTARGMILNQQYDNSRIGGGIGDAIEQVAKSIFNWLLQLYYVYYDEPHYASVMGQLKATEYIELSSQNLTARLIVTVAPDSMKPHDQLTEMNQALSLWESKALDIQTLLTRLNFPNPKETAAQVWLYQTNPQAYGLLNFPELTQQLQQLMASQQPQGGAPQGGGSGGQIAPPQPGSTGGVPAPANLSAVPLPK